MDLKRILGNFGCTALGTVAPPFGGMAANILKDVLGLDGKATEQEVTEAVKNASPEQVVAIKEADNGFQIELKKLDVDILKLDKEDRDSARDMKIKTKSRVPDILSIVITAGFFGVLYIMLLGGIPEGEKDVLLIMLGALGTAWANVCQYWFGSSTGSKEKTTLMGKK